MKTAITGPTGGPAGPDPAFLLTIQLAVSRKRNRVIFAAAGTGGTAAAISGAPEERRFWTWPRVGMFIVGLATVAGAVAAILALHPS